MRIFSQITVILAVLITFGAAKLRFEQQLEKDMVEQRLIQPALKEGTNLKLGQTSAAVALGGLRSLVAAVWNFRAFIHFEDLNWIKVEESYETITALQPQTTHYWDTGAWHLHTNAAVYYNEKEDLPPFRRKSMRQLYHDKGATFLEEGSRQNPDNWRLHLSLARLWSDRYKMPDYQRSVEHYQDTLACSALPEFKRRQLERFTFYNLSMIPERYPEALAMGTALFKKTNHNHLPNLVCTIFALQNELNTPLLTKIPEKELFPNKRLQQKWLKNYWRGKLDGLPVTGVKEKIYSLEKAPTS